MNQFGQGSFPLVLRQPQNIENGFDSVIASPFPVRHHRQKEIETRSLETHLMKVFPVQKLTIDNAVVLGHAHERGPKRMPGQMPSRLVSRLRQPPLTGKRRQ